MNKILKKSKYMKREDEILDVKDVSVYTWLWWTLPRIIFLVISLL